MSVNFGSLQVHRVDCDIDIVHATSCVTILVSPFFTRRQSLSTSMGDCDYGLLKSSRFSGDFRKYQGNKEPKLAFYLKIATRTRKKNAYMMLKVALEKKQTPDLRLMNKAVCAFLNWGMWKTVGVVMMAAPHWSECDPVQYGRVSSRPPGSLWPAWSWCVQYSRSHPPTARCLQLHRCCTRMVSLETYLQNETHVNRNKLFRLKLF